MASDIHAFTLVGIQNTKDAVSCPELIPDLQHKLLGITGVSHISVNRLVESIEGFYRNLGVSVGFQNLWDLPLVKVHKEPIRVGYSSDCEDRDAEEEIEKAFQVENSLAFLFTHAEFVDDNLHPS